MNDFDVQKKVKNKSNILSKSTILKSIGVLSLLGIIGYLGLSEFSSLLNHKIEENNFVKEAVLEWGYKTIEFEGTVWLRSHIFLEFSPILKKQ